MHYLNDEAPKLLNHLADNMTLPLRPRNQNLATPVDSLRTVLSVYSIAFSTNLLEPFTLS